jgi:hypothetical protein
VDFAFRVMSVAQQGFFDVSVNATAPDGVDGLCYTTRLLNGEGSLVSARGPICSTQLGNGPGGDITFVLQCDASTPENNVTLWGHSPEGAAGLDNRALRKTSGRSRPGPVAGARPVVHPESRHPGLVRLRVRGARTNGSHRPPDLPSTGAERARRGLTFLRSSSTRTKAPLRPETRNSPSASASSDPKSIHRPVCEPLWRPEWSPSRAQRPLQPRSLTAPPHSRFHRAFDHRWRYGLMPGLVVPSQLHGYTGGKRAVDAAGTTVAAVLDDLERQFTGFGSA